MNDPVSLARGAVEAERKARESGMDTAFVAEALAIAQGLLDAEEALSEIAAGTLRPAHFVADAALARLRGQDTG